jgi:hypothetical protein
MYIEIVHGYFVFVQVCVLVQVCAFVQVCVFVQVCAVIHYHPVISYLDLCMTFAVDTTCNSTVNTVTLLFVPDKSYKDSDALHGI